MKLIAANITALFFCVLSQGNLLAQNVLCTEFAELSEIGFGSNQSEITRTLLTASEPFVLDGEGEVIGLNTGYFMPIANFNVSKGEYNEDKHQPVKVDSVYIYKLYFRLPQGCVSHFENEVNFVFADDTLYRVEVLIKIPTEQLTEALELYDEIKKMLYEKYPFKFEYALKAFDTDEMVGDGTQYDKSEAVLNNDNTNREVSWVEMRDFLEHDFDVHGDYVSTGIVIYYEITLTIVNYKVTRLNGRS